MSNLDRRPAARQLGGLVATAADPRAVVLDFLESAYVAGARRAGWDLAALRCPTAPEPA